MLKTALFDYAINEKCCSVYGGRGICPLFSFPPRGIWRFKSPHPREFAIQGQKMLMPGGQPGGALGAAGIDWCITTQTSRFSFSYSISYDKNFTPKHLDNTLTYRFCLNFTNIEPTVLEKKVPVNEFVRFPMPRIIAEVK